MANEVQEFSSEESNVLRVAEANMFQQIGAIESQLNRTKGEQKAFFVAQIDAQLTPINSAISNIDALMVAAKAQKLSELNAKKSLLEGLKTKIENLPE